MGDKELLAREVVKKHALYAAGVGLIPAPIVNLAGVAALEVKMLYDLSTLYGIPFREDRVKSIVSALIGGVASTNLGYGAIGFFKSMPLIGGLMGLATLPLFASSITYAIGKVFIQHFESGGTFLDFEPEKVRAYFQTQFGKAKTAA
jgi:uncharacterized protein (DUF697 family)